MEYRARLRLEEFSRDEISWVRAQPIYVSTRLTECEYCDTSIHTNPMAVFDASFRIRRGLDYERRGPFCIFCGLDLVGLDFELPKWENWRTLSIHYRVNSPHNPNIDPHQFSTKTYIVVKYLPYPYFQPIKKTSL